MRLSKTIPGILSLSLIVLTGLSQPSLDSIQLKNLRGKIVPLSSVAQKSTVILFCFWSVNSDASISELNAISSQYGKWSQINSFRFIPICADEGNQLNRMKSTANMNTWGFDVFADVNGDLRRELNAVSLPESMILVNGKIVYQQSGYESGSEQYLFNKVLSLAPPPPKK